MCDLTLPVSLDPSIRFWLKFCWNSGGNYPVYPWKKETLQNICLINIQSHIYVLDEYDRRKYLRVQIIIVKLLYIFVSGRGKRLVYTIPWLLYSVCCQLNRIKMTHQFIIFWHLLHGLKIVRVLRNSIHVQHIYVVLKYNYCNNF